VFMRAIRLDRRNITHGRHDPAHRGG